MITHQTIISDNVISPFENTIEAENDYIYLTAFLNKGAIAIDDLAIDVHPISFTSPIKCKKVATFGVNFLFYVTRPGLSVKSIQYPAFLPAELPMYLQ